MDGYNKEAQAVVKILGLLQVLVFFMDVLLYSIVWLTILQSTRRLHKFDEKEDKSTKKSENKGKSYAKTAKVLTLFVLAYFTQCWVTIIFFGIYPFFGDPPLYWNIVTVAFYNSGGLFNMLSYTMVRRWSSNKKSNEESSASATQVSQVK